MDEDKRKALEAAGRAFGDAEDFLELTPDERAEVERRIAAGDLVDPPAEAPVTPSSGNVFADIGCSEPELELAIADAFAAWYMDRPDARPRVAKETHEGFRAGFRAGMKHAAGGE